MRWKLPIGAFAVAALVMVSVPLASASQAKQTSRSSKKTSSKDIFHVTTNLMDLKGGSSIKLTVAHYGKRKVKPSMVTLYFLNARDEVVSSKTVKIGPGKPASLRIRRGDFRTRSSFPVRAVYHQPMDSKLALGMSVEMNRSASDVVPFNDFEVSFCPPKIPPDTTGVIDQGPCGCGVGRPGDFVASGKHKR